MKGWIEQTYSPPVSARSGANTLVAISRKRLDWAGRNQRRSPANAEQTFERAHCFSSHERFL